MSHSAHVTSLEAIREFQRELKRYEIAMRGVLESLHGQAHRALDWIEHDQARYWPREVLRSQDKAAEARADLQRAQMTAVEGQHKSCVDERKAVQRAVARTRLCEDKVRQVKHWRNVMRHKSEEFTGKLARMKDYLDNDLPRAQAAIERVILALEKYTDTKQAPRERTRYEITDNPVVEPSAGDDEASE